jgi:hypothetical protein
MTWEVIFHDDFSAEFAALDQALQDELLAHAILLRDYGSGLGRPTVDTLKGSKHSSMKELRKRRLIRASLRFAWSGEVWRVAFAFDSARQAILLVGGDKGGADQRRFYQQLIAKADARFDSHLATLAKIKKEHKHGK